MHTSSARSVHCARPNEQGLTVTHMLTAVVGLGVAMVAMFLVIKPSPSKHAATRPTVAPVLQPVLRTLQRDVNGTRHAIQGDTNGCGHAARERAVVSFLADGSAAERASWYVETRGGESMLVHRDCRNGSVVSSSVITAVRGRPVIACTPCGHFDSIRFSYDAPGGLTSVVAYRDGSSR